MKKIILRNESDTKSLAKQCAIHNVVYCAECKEQELIEEMQTVVYHLSNNDKEKIVKIPKNAKNIIGNGIYLDYDLPIGKFGYMTHSEHLGYENADVVVLNYR